MDTNNNGNYTDEVEPVPKIVYFVSNVALILCTILVIVLIRTFARPDVGIAYLSQVFISWLFGFAGTLVLLPLDISASVAQSPCKDTFEGAEMPPCGGNFKSNDHFFIYIWKVVYWVTFVFSWIICPIVMDYSVAGEFKAKEKLIAAIVGKIKFYVIVGVLGIVLIAFIMLTTEFTINQLLGYIIALSNIYGTGLIVVMMGYGMIEFPRSVWRASNPKRQLDNLFYQAPSVEGELLDMRERIDILRERLLDFQRQIPSNDLELIENVQRVLSKLPPLNQLDGHSGASSRRMHESEIQENHADIPIVRNITNNALIRFHYVVKSTVMEYERACHEWENIISETRKLAVIVAYRENKFGKNNASIGIGDSDLNNFSPSAATSSFEVGRNATPSIGRSSSSSNLSDTSGRQIHRLNPNQSISIDTQMIEVDPNIIVEDSGNIFSKPFILWWRLKGGPVILRIFGIFSWIQTIILLWNECTIPIDITYSIYGALIHLAAFQRSYVWIEITSFIFLSYMSISCYTALFKFRLLDFLRLYPNRQSHVYAMLGNSAYLGRLQFALGFNFFSMIYDSESDITAFHYLVGDLADAGPLLGSSFNKYVPMVMAIFAISTFFNIVDRALNLIGFNTHQHPKRGNRDHEETIEQGKRLVENERKRRQRHIERLDRQRAKESERDDIINSRADSASSGIVPSSPFSKNSSMFGTGSTVPPSPSSRATTLGAILSGGENKAKISHERSQSSSAILGAPGSGLANILGSKSGSAASTDAAIHQYEGQKPIDSQQRVPTRTISPPIESSNSLKNFARTSVLQIPSSFRSNASNSASELPSISESPKSINQGTGLPSPVYQQPFGTGMRNSSSFSSIEAIRNDMNTPPPSGLSAEEQAEKNSLFGLKSHPANQPRQSNIGEGSFSSFTKRNFSTSSFLAPFQSASDETHTSAASSSQKKLNVKAPTNQPNLSNNSNKNSTTIGSEELFGKYSKSINTSGSAPSTSNSNINNNDDFSASQSVPQAKASSIPGKRNLF